MIEIRFQENLGRPLVDQFSSPFARIVERDELLFGLDARQALIPKLQRNSDGAPKSLAEAARALCLGALASIERRGHPNDHQLRRLLREGRRDHGDILLERSAPGQGDDRIGSELELVADGDADPDISDIEGKDSHG